MPLLRLYGFLCSGWLTCAGLFPPPCAAADGISFRLSQQDSRLTVTLLGSDPVFYPTVLRMLADGRWAVLLPTAGSAARSGLSPGESLDLQWPKPGLHQDSGALEQMQPVMVRYFEQTGLGLGQIAFFQPPPRQDGFLNAGYADGVLVIDAGRERTNAVRATWVLWPQEDGVRGLLEPLRLEPAQPPAQRIDWRSAAGELRIETGGGLPEITVLHETDRGFVLQTVPGGSAPSNERGFRIHASPALYRLACAALAAAVLALLLYFVRTRRRVAP